MEQVKTHVQTALQKAENYIRTSQDPLARTLRDVETRLGVNAVHVVLGTQPGNPPPRTSAQLSLPPSPAIHLSHLHTFPHIHTSYSPLTLPLAPLPPTGSVALILMLLVFDNAIRFVGQIVGVVYPAYMSLKAIESVNKNDDTQWLVYWVVFAVFSLLEIFAG